jgi:hypothetical protein
MSDAPHLMPIGIRAEGATCRSGIGRADWFADAGIIGL